MCLPNVLRVEIDVEEARGEGASEDALDTGCGKEMYMPWVPRVQSRYEEASSKSVSSDILHEASRQFYVCEGQRHIGSVPAF